MPSLSHSTVQNMLPYGHPMLLVDRVESYEPERRTLTAVKKITHSDPFLRGHFPGSPIFPGVLIIKALSQACMLVMRLEELGANDGTPIKDVVETVMNGYTAPQSVLLENRIKHMSPLYPGDELRLEVTMKKEEAENEATFKVRAFDANHTPAGKGTLRIQRTVEDLSTRKELS